MAAFTVEGRDISLKGDRNKVNYKIRPMRHEDIEAVSKLEKEVFPELSPANYYRELNGSLAHYIVACDNSIKPPPFAYRNFHWPFIRRKKQPADHIIGFVGIWFIAGESHLVSIAVRENYRQQGLGELLLIAILELSIKLKANMVTLEVRSSNTPAQNLYIKYSFTVTGRRRGYYSDNKEDAIIMTLDNPASETYQRRLQELKESYAKKWGTADYSIG